MSKVVEVILVQWFLQARSCSYYSVKRIDELPLTWTEHCDINSRVAK
jgi:hypothetical protein